MLKENKDFRWDPKGLLSMFWCKKWIDIILDGYTPISLIAAGANGVTYKARHEITERDVAIKVWMPRRRQYQQQFLNEIRKLSSLRDDAIVTVHDGKILPSGLCVAVYDYVEGISLDEWLQNKPPVQKRLGVCQEILRAVHYYQSQGVLHGDLHGGNILISKECHVTIIDFGTSVFAQDGQNRERELSLISKLVISLLNTCKMFNQAHFAFQLLSSPQSFVPRIKPLSEDLFDFSLEPILMTETMQAYTMLMEHLEYVPKLHQDDMVSLSELISQSSYLAIDRLIADIMKKHVDPASRKKFLEILDENIEESSFPALIEDTEQMDWIFYSSLLAYGLLAKKVKPMLVNPIENGTLHVSGSMSIQATLEYRQLISELNRWMYSNKGDDYFVASPALQQVLGKSLYEINNEARFILFLSLNEHFDGALQFQYWIGTKIREFAYNPILKDKLETVMAFED